MNSKFSENTLMLINSFFSLKSLTKTPALFTSQMNFTLRVYINYFHLNIITIMNLYLILIINEIFDNSNIAWKYKKINMQWWVYFCKLSTYFRWMISYYFLVIFSEIENVTQRGLKSFWRLICIRNWARVFLISVVSYIQKKNIYV